MDGRTLSQIARDEQIANRQSLIDAGESLSNRDSNRTVVNNTDVPNVDSQGVPGSLARRDEPNVSFNMATYEAYENYDPNDPLASVEAQRASATVKVEDSRPVEARQNVFTLGER